MYFIFYLIYLLQEAPNLTVIKCCNYTHAKLFTYVLRNYMHTYLYAYRVIYICITYLYTHCFSHVI